MLKKYVLIAMSAVLLGACTSTTTTTTVPNADSVEHYMSAEKIDPTIQAASYNVQLGMGYLQQGDTQRAKRKLLLATSQAPDWAPAQEAMGFYLLNTGDPEAAEVYYKRAVNINPKAGAAQNNYGVYLCRMGRYQEANNHYMLAVQDPNYINTAEAYENAGLCAMQAHTNAKAMDYFQKAIAQDPKRTTSYLELAQLNYQQNSFQNAQQYFNNYSNLVGDNMRADGLWLGIRLARKTNDQVLAQQYTLDLQNKYPNSNEYRQLMKSSPRIMPTV